MTKKKFQCDSCGYYWEVGNLDRAPHNCPVCESTRIHRAVRHQRFAKKARPKIRRSISFIGGR
jgi:predicted Zn-ribbon and HTH transcriptional regulator